MERGELQLCGLWVLRDAYSDWAEMPLKLLRPWTFGGFLIASAVQAATASPA